MHGFGFFGVALMLLFWVGLIFLSVWLVKALFQEDSSSSRQNNGEGYTANEILDQRYARGEITREQYEIMKKDIA